MRFMVLLAAAVAVATVVRAETPEEKDVTAVVQGLFDAMKANDGAKARGLFAAGATLTSIRPDGKLATLTAEEFAARVERSKEPLVERMWEPRVLVQGRIAMLWAPYDFYRQGKFDHCGIDLINLAKVDGAWKITSVSYTNETQGCPVSPLGTPK